MTWLEPTAQGIALIVAAGGFVFGIVQYFRQERLKLEDRRIEAARPFLELQLELYKAATAASSLLSSSDNEDVRRDAVSRLEELYWGHLSMVEDAGVEAAIVRLKAAIDEGKPQETLQGLSLALAHACRSSLASSWNTNAWLDR
jgi:phosphoenolpyruvate-protein kinase (PTS system EI component)